MRCLVVWLCIGACIAYNTNALQISLDLTDESGNAARVNELVEALEPKLHALYFLCRADPLCASRFYLALSTSTDPIGNDATRAYLVPDSLTEAWHFFTLAVMWAQSDDCPLQANALRSRLTLSDYDADDAEWWLTVMSTASFCGDLQTWIINQGCVAKPDRVDGNGDVASVCTAAGSANVLVSITIALFAIIIAGCIVAVAYKIRQSITKLESSIDELRKAKL